mgnify:FL=1
MLRKLKLYGELAEFVGHKEFEIEAIDLTRVTSFLINNFEGIEEYMNHRYYQVKVGNYTIDKSELLDPIGEEDIHIVPVIAGSSGVGRTILGAVFIGVAIATGGASLTFGAGGFSAVAGSSIGMSVLAGNIGLYLTLSGVAQMLTPTPEAPTESPSAAFAFGSIQNTSRAGLPVPIVYGEIVVGSLVISAGLDVEAVKV